MIVHRYNSTGNSNSKPDEDHVTSITRTTTSSSLNRNDINNNSNSSSNRHHHGLSPMSPSSSIVLSRSISPTTTSVISPSYSFSLQSIRRIKNSNNSNHHHSPRRRMMTTKQNNTFYCCFYTITTLRMHRTKYYSIILLFVIPLLLLISIFIMYRVNILHQQQHDDKSLLSSATTTTTTLPSSLLYGKCAINLYGLPRQYATMVHNSIIENIIIPNIQYNCDYYIHYYNTITIETNNELRGVDLNHGNYKFNPNEIFLLQNSIYKLHEIYYNNTILLQFKQNKNTNNSNTRIPPYIRPIVQYSTTSEDDFRIQYQSLIETIHTYQYPILNNQNNHRNHNQNQYNQYKIYQTLSDTSLSFTNNTYINIIKMYHSQQSVFQLMDNNNQQNNHSNDNNNNNYNHHDNTTEQQQHIQDKPKLQQHYTRIGMFRNDVLYVTPINIYQIPKTKQYFNHNTNNNNKNKNKKRSRQSTNEQQQNDYEYDINNQYAIIPNFGQYPINDRMIIGPYDAIKIYTTYKFRLLYDHVHTLAQLQKQQLQQQQSFLSNILLSFISKKSSNNNYKQQHRTSLLHGIHSENLLYYTIFPYIQDAGIQIIIDPNICFLRVRTDYTIRISDCGIQCSKVPKIYTNIQYIESILNRTCIQPIDTSIPNVPFLSCPPLSILSSSKRRQQQQQNISKNRKRNRRHNNNVNHRRNNKNYKLLIKNKDYTIKSKLKLQQQEQEQEQQQLSNDSNNNNNNNEFDKQQQRQQQRRQLRLRVVRQQKQKRNQSKLKWSSCPWE